MFGLLLLIHLAAQPQADAAPAPPAPLPRVQFPRGNPYSAAKAELGRRLFFEPRLSSDGKTSCASCHVPVRAFGSSRAIPSKPGGREGERHAPALVNRAYGKVFGWAGQWEDLESAIAAHFVDRGLMGHDLASALAALPAPPEPLDALALRQALATFIRTLLSGNSPYDRYMAGDRNAMTPAAARGRDLFFGKANCSACHALPFFSSEAFASIGAGAQNPPDEGRAAVTGRDSDYRLFRIPGLREIARSAPYFHDGSVASLEAVISFYDRGGELTENPDPRLQPLRLSDQDKRDLLEFLHALSGEGWQAALPAQ